MDMLKKNLRWFSSNPELARGQAAAGTAAGVGQPAVSKIIQGKTKEPGYRTVMGLAKHYGVSMDDLVMRDLERDGPSNPSQPAGLNAEKLADLIETVDGAIADSGRPVPAKLKARLLAMLYTGDGASAANADAIRAALTSILLSLEET